MNPFRFLTIAVAIAPWLAAIALIAYSSGPEPDWPEQYAACRAIHPERYCRLTFMQSTVATEEADGRR